MLLFVIHNDKTENLFFSQTKMDTMAGVYFQIFCPHLHFMHRGQIKNATQKLIKKVESFISL